MVPMKRQTSKHRTEASLPHISGTSTLIWPNIYQMPKIVYVGGLSSVANYIAKAIPVSHPLDFTKLFLLLLNQKNLFFI